MQHLTFQPTQQADIPAIIHVLTEATGYKVGLGDMSWGKGAWKTHEIQDRMDKGNTFYLVRVGKKVAGTVSLGWQDQRNWGKRSDEAGYIHQLAIGDDFHGQQIGEQIITWLSEQVANHGRSYIRLDCDTHNTSLCAYYERLGFKRVNPHKRPDNEMGEYEAALYQKPVGKKA